ncbi:MAG: TetR/AcrR family transcriptional regulator [Sphingomonadaceae bacterium]
MPLIVDHDERRVQIARVVEQLVYDRGIDGLTIRDVANQVGCSTSVISHYFRSKLEMLTFTQRQARLRTIDRLNASIEEGRGYLEAIEEVLPLTEEYYRDWHTWFAFWGMAPTEPTVSREWAEASSTSHGFFAELIRRGQEDGSIPASVNETEAATTIQIIVNGIASLVSQDRSAWPADRQTSVCRKLFKKLFQD